MTAHAAMENTFFEDFSVQKMLTIIRSSCQEGLSTCRSTDRDTDENRDDIDKCVACSLRKSVGYARFLDDVAEKQHTDQRKSAGSDECADDERDYREDDFFTL